MNLINNFILKHQKSYQLLLLNTLVCKAMYTLASATGVQVAAMFWPSTFKTLSQRNCFFSVFGLYVQNGLSLKNKLLTT